MYEYFYLSNNINGGNMFTKYEIKYENNEEVLYLYLSYDYEFANLDINNKVKQYINNIKIKFNGIKVVIVVGGIIIGSLFLNANDFKRTSLENISIDYELKNETFFNKPLELDNFVYTETEKKEIKDNDSSKIEIVTEIQTKEKENKKEQNISTITKQETTKIEQNEPIKTTTTKNNQSTNQKVETVVKDNWTSQKGETKEEVTNKTIVTVLRSNGTVLNIELEEYLIGVVAAEMPASFNMEALKAQAVVARTYTLKKLENNQVLSDTVKDQVYKDSNQLKSMWGNSYNTYYNKIKQAVLETKGEYITYNGKYIEALYHSTSNGYTEDASFVWGNSFPYLVSVESNWDKSASSYLKTETKSLETVSNILGLAIDENTLIEVLDTTSGNRVKQIKIGDKIFDGVELRNLLGLRSTDFDMEIKNDSIVFTTRGYGHGVGMSQYGANGMAKNGYNYLQIIHHYYKNVTIEK